MTGRCLVLGAGGRVGRLLRGVWAETVPGTKAVFQSRKPGDGIDLVSDLDVGAIAAFSDAAAFDGVLVLAGVTSGTPSDLAANTELAFRALNFAQTLAIPRVFLCSSAAVYQPQADHPPFKETDVTAPTRPYGQSKLAMEAAADAWWRGRETTLQISCLRMANMIGADMLASSARRATASEPLALDQFSDGGSPERAYLSPATCAAVVAALTEDVPRPGVEVLNVADAGAPIAMHSILDTLTDFGHRIEWRWTPAPETAIRNVGLDTTRLQSRLPTCTTVHRPASAGRLVGDWLAASGGQL